MSTESGAPRIAVLEPVVANQIAAGEVVERPASVVKELVENSLDAGATRIEVSVSEGGKRLLRVRDNGCGMGQQDAILCLQRHATSKIRSAEDLQAIVTLGFRGEALPSIASVSQMRLVTRPTDSDRGWEVVVEGGAVTGFQPVGCPIGTDITVKNLFFNVPARLKFLKTEGTEMEHITGLLTAYSLLHHAVSFRLEHNGRQVLSSPGTGDLRGAVATLFGADLAREMVPVDLNAGNLRVTGLTSKPGTSRANRNQQWFFVNGRPVRSRSLNYAVYEAYHTLLTHGRHPVTVICIEADPATVDVNVHPAKHEVRFTREWEVAQLVRRAVKQALETAQLLTRDTALPEPPRPVGAPAAPQAWQAALPATDLPGSRDTAAPALSQPALFEPAADGEVADLPVAAVEGERLPARIRPLGQVANSYLVCDTEQGMLVIDQHALHERILYEKLRTAEADRKLARQLLAVPLSLSFSPREAVAVETNLAVLAELGFEVEPFGKDTFLVRAVPAMLRARNPELVLRDVIDDLVAEATPRTLEAQRDLVLRTMACKAAVKAGDALAPEEIDELLRLMRESNLPFHCNHGRPTMFTLPTAALEKRFDRR